MIMDRPEYHSTDRLKDGGVEKASGRYSILRGPERSTFNQTSIVKVSRATLGRLPATWGGARMSQRERHDVILSRN